MGVPPPNGDLDVNGLTAVRFYDVHDPVYADVDNRPLSDLRQRDVEVQTIAEGAASAAATVASGLSTLADKVGEDTTTPKGTPPSGPPTYRATPYTVANGDDHTTAIGKVDLKQELQDVDIAALQAAVVASSVPAGTVLFIDADTPPSGYLEANGASVSPTTYYALAAALAGRHGFFDTNAVAVDYTTDTFTFASHGLVDDDVIFLSATAMPTGLSAGVPYFIVNASLTTFQVSLTEGGSPVDFSDNGTAVNFHTLLYLPDLRAEFIRGWDNGRGVDSGRVLGSFQADLLKSHAHSVTYASGGFWVESGNDIPWGGSSTGSTGGVETRPRNVALLPVIKI